VQASASSSSSSSSAASSSSSTAWDSSSTAWACPSTAPGCAPTASGRDSGCDSGRDSSADASRTRCGSSFAFFAFFFFRRFPAAAPGASTVSSATASAMASSASSASGAWASSATFSVATSLGRCCFLARLRASAWAFVAFDEVGNRASAGAAASSSLSDLCADGEGVSASEPDRKTCCFSASARWTARRSKNTARTRLMHQVTAQPATAMAMRRRSDWLQYAARASYTDMEVW